MLIRPSRCASSRRARVDDVDAAGHAGIERVDGAQDFDRPLADRRPACRAAPPRTDRVGPWRRAGRRSTCSARRTGSWRSAPLWMCTQWPSAPRGASWKPAPIASAGQRTPAPTSSCRGCAARRRAMFAASASTHRPSSRRAPASRCRARRRGRASRTAPRGRRRASSARASTSSFTRAWPDTYAPACARAGRPPSARRRSAATSARSTSCRCRAARTAASGPV